MICLIIILCAVFAPWTWVPGMYSGNPDYTPFILAFFVMFAEIPFEIYLFKKLKAGSKKVAEQTNKVIDSVKEYKELKDLEHEVKKELLKKQLRELKEQNNK